MTRARTKGQKIADKRRQREQATQLPEIAPVPRRAAQGSRRMNQIKRETVDDIPTLQARCRQAGLTPTAEAIRDAKAPWRGCSAGVAMSRVVTDEAERADLWDAIQHMRRTQMAHDVAIGAPRRHAQCLRLLVPLEALEADAETPPLDLRTDEEKQRQATSALMAIEGWLAYASPHAASICKRTVIDDERCPDAHVLVEALRCVVDGIKGRKIVYRGA
ncbi:hypothetical protein [Pontibaca methylaminivorans]|uniref:Uncharacterized protein n=1 Tax=Pontibaca methylaminivorans TaxID=515897 RepID=A0A1R3WAB9_9RHOB|nr:hypothetical protein [Pontibaca methylaminivorans]SIT74718.1 hypothetical protein SAMN05421849_0203 [Pontibaca methylaminivorans]